MWMDKKKKILVKEKSKFGKSCYLCECAVYNANYAQQLIVTCSAKAAHMLQNILSFSFGCVWAL